VIAHAPSIAVVAWVVFTGVTGWFCPAGWAIMLAACAVVTGVALWRRYRHE
jgi:hypothetical protein